MVHPKPKTAGQPLSDPPLFPKHISNPVEFFFFHSIKAVKKFTFQPKSYIFATKIGWK